MTGAGVATQARRPGEMLGTCTGALLEFLVVSMSGLLVPLMAMELGASAAGIGVLIGVTNLGALVAAVPAGFLVARMGTRRLIVGSCVLAGASCFFVYLFPSIASLYLGLTVFGVGWTVFAVAVQCHIGAIGGKGDVNTNFGWYGTSVALGQMIGPLLSGILIDTAGTSAAWLVMAILVTATGAGLSFVLGPGTVTAPAREPASRRPFRLASLMNLAIAVGILSSFVSIFALGVRSSFFPVFLVEAGYTASLIGAIDSVRGLTSVASRASIGPALKLLGGRFPLLTVCHVILAAGIAATPFCVSVPLLMASAVLIGIGFGVVTPVCQAIVFDGAPPEHRSVAMGVRMTGNRLAQMASPLAFGFVIAKLDMSAAFVASGILLFALTSPMLFWWVRTQRATGRAPAL